MIEVKLNELKKLMKERNINQDQLSKLIGVDPGLVSKILNGKRKTVGKKFIRGLLSYSKLDFNGLFFISPNIYLNNEITNSNFTGNAPENPQVESSNVKIGKVSFEKTKGACGASDEFEKRKEAQCVKPQTSRI